MAVISFLLAPFFWFYVLIFRFREKRFGRKVNYNYLPEEFVPFALPLHMDLLWCRRGFLGLNKCFVPKGTPYSARFDDASPWFQSWIGHYSLDSIVSIPQQSELEQVQFLSQAAIADQNYWLFSYGMKNPKSQLDKESLRKVSERLLDNGLNQKVYYGEIHSGIDDSRYNKFDFRFTHLASTKIASLYNHTKVEPKLLDKDLTPSKHKRVNLFGYFSVIEINPKKYLLNYVCGSLENKEKIDPELQKIILNIAIT